MTTIPAGRAICPTCKGQKREGPYFNDPVCRRCNGVGHVEPCQRCGGRGAFSGQDSGKGLEWITCDNCKGLGAPS
jgi:hypothetical protein